MSKELEPIGLMEIVSSRLASASGSRGPGNPIGSWSRHRHFDAILGADLGTILSMRSGELRKLRQRKEDFPMTDARCSCGALTLTLPGPSRLVAACHCLDCQRRTGAPFGVGAFYPVDAVAISGTAKEFTRDAASGGKVHSYFCPNCGSTIYWRADNLPSLIGVAVGALADPTYPAPVRSVFERSKHHWVTIDGAVEHFRQSSVAKTSS
jgi:hypothetical protein